MAVAPSARACGATVVTPVAMAVAKPKSANRLILLVVVHIVILLGGEGDGVDSSRLPRLHLAGYIVHTVSSSVDREV